MNSDVASVASLELAVAGLLLMTFTVGALAGWRWASPRVRHEPTGIFVSGHVGWGLLLVSLVLAPAGEAWASGRGWPQGASRRP